MASAPSRPRQRLCWPSTWLVVIGALYYLIGSPWIRALINVVSKVEGWIIDFTRKEQSGKIQKFHSKTVTDTDVSCANARKIVLQQSALGHAGEAKRRGVDPQGYPLSHVYAKAGRCS